MLDEELKQIVSGIIYVRLRSIAEIIVNRKTESIEIGHRNKIIGLRADKCNRVPTQPMLDPVTNLSIYNLTYDEHTALINGLNHVYPSTRFDQSKFICNIEYFYSRLINFRTSYRHYESKHASEIVRHELTSLQLGVAAEVREAANSYRKVADSELKRTVMQNRKTFGILRSLAKNKDIIITRPDKGRGVVVMDRSDYMQKMNAILDDRSYFSLIDDDPTLVNENRLIHLLLDLKREGFISDSEYSLARPTGSRPARIYGLPKLHKQDCPLRPVMSATKTVSYGLGKMLTNCLNHLRTSRYVIKDTFDFVKKIRASEHMEKRMVSFDVKSLFTNVPLTYTIDLILDKMYPSCSLVCKSKQKSRLCAKCRKRRDFETLLKIAISETHFIFDKKMYVQHNGVAMGAPLAPVIADIFLSHLEETLMDRLVKSGVCEWFRYVDDTFILIEPNTNINDLLNILNTFHPSISFTHEVERDGSLSFLDVCVTRSLTSQKLDTTIYRKPTYTGLLIKWDSFVPLSYKKACIVSMVQRALAVCSTYALLSQEFQTIREIGQKNDYPSSFIDTRIGIGLGNYLKKLTTSNEAVAGCAKQRMYVEIPYTGTSSKMLKNKLSRISIKHRPDLEVCFFERPSPPVQIIFNVKDPIPKHLQANIIYSIQCSNCGDAYVGKTERQGIRRLWENGAPISLFSQKPFLPSEHTGPHDHPIQHQNQQEKE
ncbi:unnamed protein product [Rotaria socialis]|uniref:Reverse transcriptase domain-containing protein n=2 Tax=Rotaria socialis TaxID=392032 RepID=A0A821L126_9BILA|nr:unnamed protein product [Rotaria socialis]CAF4743776.1 unnamed protein product [Rotaria socialis]